MRMKRMISAVAVLLILGALTAFVLWPSHQGPEPSRPGQTPAVVPTEVPPVKTNREVPAVSHSSEPHSETNHEISTAQRITQLQDLAYEEDSASLNKILAALKDPAPEIRKAAVEAAIQFGSREAIPKLQEAAQQTTHREEKLRLLDAAEFLKLPSLTEILSRTNRPAAK